MSHTIGMACVTVDPLQFQINSAAGMEFIDTTEFKIIYEEETLSSEWLGFDGETCNPAVREVHFK